MRNQGAVVVAADAGDMDAADNNRICQLTSGFGLANSFCNTETSESTGLEPATSAVTGRRSNQLS